MKVPSADRDSIRVTPERRRDDNRRTQASKSRHRNAPPRPASTGRQRCGQWHQENRRQRQGDLGLPLGEDDPDQRHDVLHAEKRRSSRRGRGEVSGPAAIRSPSSTRVLPPLTSLSPDAHEELGVSGRPRGSARSVTSNEAALAGSAAIRSPGIVRLTVHALGWVDCQGVAGPCLSLLPTQACLISGDAGQRCDGLASRRAASTMKARRRARSISSSGPAPVIMDASWGTVCHQAARG